MDSDEFGEFDDDIADEDLIFAATQASNNIRSSNSVPNSKPHAPRPSGAQSGSSFTKRPIGAQPLPSLGKPEVIDLDELPLDGFSSSPDFDQTDLPHPSTGQRPPASGPVRAYHQTTLFGQPVQNHGSNGVAPSTQRVNSNRVFRADLPVEAPTHHETDTEAMKTWVYPTNLGPTRDYQYSIVNAGLFNNTLVALPTGLGKTFIAATIMLNFFRWTKTAKIVFVAPTKPLVSQQIDACFNIAGIPRSTTTLLTGDVSPALRAEEWATKRVFFMTPQTIQNDLSTGVADPKSIGLLVVDEAHRATGNYAYVKVIDFIRRFSKSFRVLALTATPGSTVEAIQEVIDNLGISQVEIRTEESIDIRPYVHSRIEDVVVLDPSEEMGLISELFTKTLKPVVDKLSSQNIFWGRDPMSITTFGLMKARQDWARSAGRHLNEGLRNMINAVFTLLQKLAHPIKLLNFHGIKPFYEHLVQFRNEVEGRGAKGGKTNKQITESPHFQKMMSTVGAWLKKEDFVSHPKLTHLSETVMNHFLDAGEGREGGGSSNTRIIVFSEYRDSAEEIVRVLNRQQPMIRAAVFVGQADTKQSDGMKQSEQIERIQKFKEGTFNVLVATSIGEEGLDIGQVDLIICYDASSSPIKMLQRMGRTGRKRAGKVVLLLMRGKEEDKYASAKDAYNQLQAMICDGKRFNFRHDLSTRIVPRDIKPQVDKRPVEIPLENTQNPSLPEPRRGRAAKAKKPPKKFNMPDGVETGFTSVAAMLGNKPKAVPKATAKAAPKAIPKTMTKAVATPEEDDVADIPSLGKVELNEQQRNTLRHAYQNLPFYQHKVEVVAVDVTANPITQRYLGKTSQLRHGEHTKRCVKLLKRLSKIQSTKGSDSYAFGKVDQSCYDDLPYPDDPSESELHVSREPAPKRRRVGSSPKDHDERVKPDHSHVSKSKGTVATKPPKRNQIRKPKHSPVVGEDSSRAILVDDEDEDVESEPPSMPQRRQRSTPGKSRQSTSRPGKNPRSKKGASRVYDESADEGDDCRRTSDLELTDESDDGSDLVGFVVGDDIQTSSMVPTSSMIQRSSSPTTPSTSSTLGRNPKRTRRVYEPALSATQESRESDSDTDDDLPSLKHIAATQRHAQSSAQTDTDSGDSQDEVVKKSGRGYRRTVISDEDDDDEDDDYD
ncbi:fanconi anemia group M [Apiospora arundinis]|uniref:ATP-dependent DNA helicase n=1 Tax=Apiospora arundinis TaxID=335852 RepID=A0ABR2J8S0_9PEZI